MTEQIRIAITGGEKEDRDVVSQVVNQSLFDAGFRNLVSAEPMFREHVPTLLEKMQKDRPGMFLKEVFIDNRNPVEKPAESTTHQEAVDQVVEALTAVAKAEGLEVTATYTDGERQLAMASVA